MQLEYIYCKNIKETKYLQQIYDFLITYEAQFCPSLSLCSFNSNNSCTIKEISEIKNIGEYFNKIIDSSFILVVKENNLVGFLAFSKHFKISYDEIEINTYNISTILVHENFRNRGIAIHMIEKLFTISFEDKNKYISAVSWISEEPKHTNMLYMRLLQGLNFNPIQYVQNTRGIGINDVYYLAELKDI